MNMLERVENLFDFFPKVIILVTMMMTVTMELVSIIGKLKVFRRIIFPELVPMEITMVTAMILNQDFDKLQYKKSSQFCFLNDHGNIGHNCHIPWSIFSWKMQMHKNPKTKEGHLWKTIWPDSDSDSLHHDMTGNGWSWINWELLLHPSRFATLYIFYIIHWEL